MNVKQLSEPKQKRSIATKNKIKKATRRLISDKGYYKLTSNMIAAKAKIPIGSFYNYYKNKKGVVIELINDFNVCYHDDTVQHFEAIISGLKDPSEVKYSVHELLQLIVLSEHLEDPFYRIIHALQFTEEDILAISAQVRETELYTLEAYLHQVSKLMPLDNIALKAKIIHSTAENLALYIHHLESGHHKEDLILETATMIYSLLKIE